jgi:hypothetical protein
MPHPLQNRVTQFSEIVMVSARGAMTGNCGGYLHDAVQCLAGRR